jgi:hypothetical protein
MKRNGDIISLFQRHAAKKAASAVAGSPPCAAPVPTVVEEQHQERNDVIEENVNPMPPSSPSIPLEDVPPPPPPQPPPVYDIDRLPRDPGERLPIQNYPMNDQDAIRRSYILKGAFKPIEHSFPKRKIGKRKRQFNYVWLFNHDWLEYSIKKDSGFCLVCYFFKKGNGSDRFIAKGWRNWNIGDAKLI